MMLPLEKIDQPNWNELTFIPLNKVFSFLPIVDICHARLVCKNWNVIGKDNYLWKKVFQRDWPFEIDKKISNLSWEETYRLHYNLHNGNYHTLSEIQFDSSQIYAIEYHKNQIIYLAECLETFNLLTGKIEFLFKDVSSIQKDKNILYIGDSHGFVKVYDLEKKQIISSLQIVSLGEISHIAISNQFLLVVDSYDNHIHKISLDKFELVESIDIKKNEDSTILDLNVYEDKIFIEMEDIDCMKTISVWLNSFKKLFEIKKTFINNFSIQDDMFIINTYSKIEIYHVNTFKLIQKFKLSKAYIPIYVYHLYRKEQLYILIGDSSGNVDLYEVNSGKKKKTFEMKEGFEVTHILCIGSKMIVGYRKYCSSFPLAISKIAVWDLITGNFLYNFFHKGMIEDLQMIDHRLFYCIKFDEHKEFFVFDFIKSASNEECQHRKKRLKLN